jgi:integrase/recombinase XerD
MKETLTKDKKKSEEEKKPKKAKSIEEKLKDRKDNLKNTGASENNIKLATKFINSLIRDAGSKNSALAYLSSMSFILKNSRFEFSDATVDDIEELLDTIENWIATQGINKGSTLSSATKNNLRVHFRVFLKYISRHDLADKVKTRNLKNLKLPEDILTKDEVLEIIDKAGSLRDKAILGLLYESGCRAGEILSMKVKNIEFLNNGGCAATFPKGKTGARRVLIFNFAAYMRQWIEAHPLKDNPEAPLWVVDDYRLTPLSYSGLRFILREIVPRTSIKKRIWLHGFRHSRATHLAEYFTEQQMKSYLGWTASSDMPAVYCHLSGKDLDKTVKEMYGIEDKETPIDLMKPGKCSRCQEMNAPAANFCFRCGLPLTQETVITLESIKTDYMQLSDLDEIREMKNSLRQELEEISKLKERMLKTGK